MSADRIHLTNALHGVLSEGSVYVVLHDGTTTRYQKGQPPTSAPVGPVQWADYPEVSSPNSAHGAARVWADPEKYGHSGKAYSF